MRAAVKTALALLLCLCLFLGGCSILELEGEPVSSRPNLSLLSMETYIDDSPAAVEGDGDVSAVPRVDFWLGASRLMGGIRATDESIYPHMSKRYREGGFHYRYGNQVGLYDELLRELLAAAEGSFTRILRFGDERLPDSLIADAGLADIGDAEALRSVRRDMLTYAVSPMPSIFDGFSAESMKDSYYSLGTPKLNQIQQLTESGSAENPDKLASMDKLLTGFIDSFATGGLQGLTADGDSDFPLLYALESLDLSRLSVITFDPAEMRRLSAASAAGDVERYLQSLLEKRGVFEKGLSVGLFAFNLDYIGQMSSFGAADFAEPLIWGKLKFSVQRNDDIGSLPMPRIMLMLVIGEREQTADYCSELCVNLDESVELKGLRGPERGELEYQADRHTVTQQPFSFDYHYAVIERPYVAGLSQHTEGMTITPPEGSEVKPHNGLNTVFLKPSGAESVITVEFPINAPEGGFSFDLSKLENARAEVSAALLLSDTLPNKREADIPKGADVQTITVRDTIFVYRSSREPFADKPEQSPFKLVSLKPSTDGNRLVARIIAQSAALSEGYYRLRLSADMSERQFGWPSIDWIDGANSLDAAVTNDKLADWETFSALIHEHQSSVPNQFQHAWGPYSERSYHGMDYPDFPAVYRVPWLKELAAQLRAAANVDSAAYLRCVFDVFVENTAEP